jgi:hypothetical protein
VSEKKPWKTLEPLDGIVETQFVRNALLGECVVPFRLLPPGRCVVPCDGNHLLSGDNPRIDRFPRLAEWWREAERLWAQYSSGRLTLIKRVDYRHGLRDQLPGAPQRVVYSSSGMHVAAARVSDPSAIIDNSLYWAAVGHDLEGLYLTAVLNSAVTTTRVRPLLPYSKLERHIHKHVWKLPIPLFDSNLVLHREIAELGHAVELEIAALAIDAHRHFASVRRDVRAHLAISEAGRRIDNLVANLLGERG